MQTDTASLSNLKDIVEPAAVGLWPPAPGVVLLGLLGLVWVAVAVLLWRQHRRRNAYRRIALRELDAIAGEIRIPESRTAGIRRISVLLKRVALAAYPRAEVAALSGDGWNAFLDRRVPGAQFGRGPGQVLAAVLSQPDPGGDLNPADCDGLIRAARLWINGHSNRAGKGN